MIVSLFGRNSGLVSPASRSDHNHRITYPQLHKVISLLFCFKLFGFPFGPFTPSKVSIAQELSQSKIYQKIEFNVIFWFFLVDRKAPEA